MWAAFVLILPNRSLAVLGNAGFFAAFVLLLVPPMFPVQVYLSPRDTSSHERANY